MAGVFKGVLVSSAGANNIYLSPHHDDAAFSLGAWISKRPGGVLLNLFTRSEFVAGGAFSGVEAVSAVRAAEDDAFVRGCGLDVVRLGLAEPSLRGRKSRDASHVADDIGQLRRPLGEWLDANVDDASVIFCPAGIGGHVNHLATRLVAWEWVVARGRETQLRFYEDLPYASRPHLRWRGLKGLRAATAGWRLERRAWRAGPDKLELVHLYPSQLDPEWTMRRFSPFALWPLGRHEAAWVPITRS